MSKTLLVIDVHNDFCPGGALAVSEGDQIIPAINGLMVGYDRVILTQDWHPKGHSSFASSHNSKAPLDMVEMPYGPQVLWPDHCMQGTFGAQLHADINQDAAALILRKGSNPLIDSYSAFFENDHVTATGLHGYLQNCGVSALDMVGLATDFCVNYSGLSTLPSYVSHIVAQPPLVLNASYASPSIVNFSAPSSGITFMDLPS